MGQGLLGLLPLLLLWLVFLCFLPQWRAECDVLPATVPIVACGNAGVIPCTTTATTTIVHHNTNITTTNTAIIALCHPRRHHT